MENGKAINEIRKIYYAEKTVQYLLDSKQVVIYGARIVAKEVATCLAGEPYQLKISAFLVTDMEGNPKKIEGIPVIEARSGKHQFKNATVIVAVLEKYLNDILDNLEREGFKNVIPLTFECDLWSEIRGNYYRWMRISQGKKYLTLEEELKDIETNKEFTQSIRVYMAKCHVDRPLHGDITRFEWEIPIQAGAALTSDRITLVRDDQGDNISTKNREYCELTALYWIWKNDLSQYAGLCHYRRHFNLSEDMLSQIQNSGIDVILTIPVLNFPDVQTMYSSDHSAIDWNIMKNAVKTLQPKYYETLDELQRGNFYYAYNMFISRKTILNDYCEWLFPILEYCEQRIGRKQDKYQNRYIGFLAERLLTLYFLHNEAKYKIVHATKTFLME